MKLFADLYLDEDVSVLVAALLRGRGLDAVTAVAEHMLGLDDSAQLAHAAARGRCVVTHNRVHFELLHRQYLASGRDHARYHNRHDSSQRLVPRTKSRAGS